MHILTFTQFPVDIFVYVLLLHVCEGGILKVCGILLEKIYICQFERLKIRPCALHHAET